MKRDLVIRQAQKRRQGSLLMLGAVTSLVLLVLFLFGNGLLWLFLQQQRYQQTLEAAALKAASDLSEIVINDPYFGFISLSDRPAVGKATLALDGQPLPVHSINTIIATTRLDYIIACELGNAQMQQFALQDAQLATEAAQRLNIALSQALTPTPKEIPHDMDGNVVKPYADALKAYKEGLNCFTNTAPAEFKLTLGWLKQTGATVTPVPVSDTKTNGKLRDLYAPSSIETKGCYKACIDLPVGKEHFCLASVGLQPSLVSAEQFVASDNSHVSSIVKVESICKIHSILPWDSSISTIKGRACAESYSMISQPSPSVLVLAFPDGCPPGLNCLADVLACQGLQTATMQTFRPTNGDFPIEAQAVLKPCEGCLADCSANTVVARAFYDWMRGNYTLPTVDSLLAASNQSFGSVMQPSGATSNIFVLEATTDGNTILSCLRNNPFADLRIAENQLYAISNQPAPIGGNNWTVVCRDEVYAMSILNGGRHAGQPLAGNPINWAQLSSYVDDRFAQAAASRMPGGITVGGQRQLGGAIPLSDVQLNVDNKQAINRPIRTSSCSAGLASEIRISSPLAPN